MGINEDTDKIWKPQELSMYNCYYRTEKLPR
jgi:hypothetical protein